jgi:hypothetical protein
MRPNINISSPPQRHNFYISPPRPQFTSPTLTPYLSPIKKTPQPPTNNNYIQNIQSPIS